MTLYNELIDEFQTLDPQLLGVSADGVKCHESFSNDRNLRFPLLADFEPKGQVAKSYGIYRKEEGTTDRALFVIDESGVIQWSCVSPIGVNPGASGILQALEGIDEGDGT